MALAMPVCQERLRVTIGRAEAHVLARIMALGGYGDLLESWDGGLRAVLQSVVPRGVITDRAWAIACVGPTALDGRTMAG